MAANALHNGSRGPCRGRTGWCGDSVEGKMRGWYLGRFAGAGNIVGKASFSVCLLFLIILFIYFY
jgi:hypothetical protein